MRAIMLGALGVLAIAACTPEPTRVTEIKLGNSAPASPAAGKTTRLEGDAVPVQTGGLGLPVTQAPLSPGPTDPASLGAVNAGTFTGVVRGPARDVLERVTTGAYRGTVGNLVIDPAETVGVKSLSELTEPIANARVVVTTSFGYIVSTEAAMTDAQGRFTIPGLNPSAPLLFIRATYRQNDQHLSLLAAAAAPRDPGEVAIDLDPATSAVAKASLRWTGDNKTVQPAVTAAFAAELAPYLTDRGVVAAAIGEDKDGLIDLMCTQSRSLVAALSKAATRNDGTALAAKLSQKLAPSPTPSP